jgi:M6 family metalloprotease-like protein
MVVAPAAVALLWLLAGSALALQPPRPGELEHYRTDGSLPARLARARRLGDDRLIPGMLRAAVQRARRAELGAGGLTLPPPAWRGMPTTGTVNVLVVPICFSDYPWYTSQQQLQARLFGSGDAADPQAYPYESLHDYYARSSYGQLDIEGDVLPWYDTGQARRSVAATDAGRERLIEQALSAYAQADPGWDPSRYDNDKDAGHTIDYVIVIWTGPNTGWSGFWWGYQTTFRDSAFSVRGEHLGAYSWQWEHEYGRDSAPADRPYDPLVTIHETGHALGLPDYYDYEPGIGPNGGVGGLDMMDDDEGDHNVFSKWLLGWLTPQVMGTGYGSVTLGPSGSRPDALVLMPGVDASSPFQQYFMVENKCPAGDNDAPLVPAADPQARGDGLLVWHVDARLDLRSGDADYLYDNSSTAHRLLRLMEADGRQDIEHNALGLGADAGDFYRAGDVLSAGSRPDSFAYGSSTKAVVVRRISAGAGALSGLPAASPLCTPEDLGVISGLPAASRLCTPEDQGVMSLYASTDWAPPVTTAGGAPSGWRRTPVALGFTATDAGSGVAFTVCRLDGGAWTAQDTLTVPADPGHADDGVHTVAYRSTDLAGNVEAARTVTVRIDTTGPVCRAPRAVAARRGRMVTLAYSVGDTLSPTADVVVRIRRGAHVVKVAGAAGVVCGARHGLRFRCRLPRGSYTFTVTARDLAGNAQHTSAVNRLTVR